MTQLPVMPVLVERLLGDTDHLSNEEMGAYMRLLFAGWLRDAELRHEDLARLARAGAGRWPRLWPRLRPFMVEVAPGVWSQKRLKKSFADAQQNAEANKARAAKARAGLSRKNKGALNNDSASTAPVTKSATETVKASVTEPVTRRKPPAKPSVTVPVEPLQPEPEKNEALPLQSRELHSSAPTGQAGALPPRVNGHVERSAVAGSPSLKGGSPTQPSEALLRSRLAQAPLDDDEDEMKRPRPVGLFGALEAAIRHGKPEED